MSHPREILSRIQRRQARRDALHTLGAPRVPAPAPAVGLSPAAPLIPNHASTPSPSAPVSPPTPVPSTPIPNPSSAPSTVIPNPVPTPTQAPVQPSARPVAGHALYSELMRSHDRMGTRHLKG